MKLQPLAILGLATGLVGCGVDPRWGERNPTNRGVPGSPGVDARWGDPRDGLREPLQWQYDDVPGVPGAGEK